MTDRLIGWTVLGVAGYSKEDQCRSKCAPGEGTRLSVTLNFPADFG